MGLGETVREIKQLNERQILILDKNNYYVVSESNETVQPTEVLVFPSDPEGNITCWLEVAGERYITLKPFMEKLFKGEVFITEVDEENEKNHSTTRSGDLEEDQ